MAPPKADTEPTRRSAVVPHKQLREHFLHRLPNYTGPYNVGYMDIEVPARDPRPVSKLRRGGKPVLRLDTVLMAIYYPCDLTKNIQKQKKPTSSPKSTRRVDWMPRPRGATSKGYAKFANIPALPVTAYLACTSLFTKLPAFRNAKLAGHWPERVLDEEGMTGQKAREEENDDDQRPRFPVIMFSHGLGGSRLCYSSICGELASFGFIVVAVEHRDGSGARTYVNLSSNEQAADIQSSTAELHTREDYDNEEDEMDASNEGKGRKQKKIQRRKAHNKTKIVHPYYTVDYILPKDNAQDTSPHSPHGVDRKLRSAQIALRLEEIKEAYYVLGLINSGQGAKVDEMNMRKKGYIGSSSVGLNGVDWGDWTGRMFLDRVSAMGHSFGGATTVQICREQSMDWIGQGVVLDAWGQGIPPGGETNRVTKPIIAISSEAFMHWKENFERVVGFCNESRKSGALCWMLTIVGSTHLSMSDFAVLYPHWLSLLMKSMVHPLRAFYLTITASLEFLNATLPPEQTKYNVWLNEQLLKSIEPASEPDEPVRPDHAPDDKYVAFRLKIPSEWKKRGKGLLKRTGRFLTCSADGQELFGPGLDTYGESEEIWTHLGPSRAQIEEHMLSIGQQPSEAVVPTGTADAAGAVET